MVEKTLHEKPPAATHWSSRKMAAAGGLGFTSVQRIWKAHGLKPHLVKTFKLSNDKRFVEKVQDIVGLYLDPPDKALVLSVDEKSQIQALDRTQPGLPMKKGRCGTMTHDYKRHGTTTLFAALDVATGKVIGQCMPRHRHQEWLKFLRLIDAETPKQLDVHLTSGQPCRRRTRPTPPTRRSCGYIVPGPADRSGTTDCCLSLKGGSHRPAIRSRPTDKTPTDRATQLLLILTA